MAINKDEIDKYIFDPENPKQCLMYKALIDDIKKDRITFISRNFFTELFISEKVDNELKKELYDLPPNYDNLSKIEKVNLYIKQVSKNDFIDLLEKNIDYLNFTKISNIFENIISFNFRTNIYYKKTLQEKISFSEGTRCEEEVLESEVINIYEDYAKLFESYNSESAYSQILYNELDRKNKIFFYDFDDFDIFTLDFFKKRTILVTTLKHKDKYFKKFHFNNKIDNIKPIFLKRIEDVEILLNVLEQDLKKEKQKTLPQENIELLNEIIIKNFFSINQITLTNLKDKKEIYIVGENGDGKTLLLQAIAVGLKGTVEDGLIEFRSRKDEFKIEIENKKEIENNFFAYGASRNNYCQIKEDKKGYLTLFSGEYDLKNPQKWLSELYSIELYNEKLGKKNAISVEKIKDEIITLLGKDVEIEVTPKGVTFTEKGAIVSFNQLSAGYRSVVTIICDLIARFSEKQPNVKEIKDFQGVVLIDEVELHLHPKWKYNFMKKLRDTFPLIQFIVTTHSPTVILGASKEAVFYKIYKEDGVVNISQPMNNIKNLMANNLSTSPLFDMETARARNNDNNLDTREDFISSKIHKIIKDRVKGKKAIVEEEIEEMINQELDEFLKENNL